MRHLSPFAALSILVTGACGPTAVDSPPAVCDRAAAALADCGYALEQSPYGTCQESERERAEQLLAVYDDRGCVGLSDAKADGPGCALPLLCVEHSVEELAPFTTDGCSMFPDGTPGERTMWQHCCVEHDFAYYTGGTREARSAADQALRECVASESSELLGDLMYAGVRLGGTPALPTPWRWGYGWKYDPTDGYRELPEEQLDLATQRVMSYAEDPTPPEAFEQRAYALWDSVATVPGLAGYVEDIEAEAREVGE